ncbi:nucleolar RNA helicase 2 isoform X2, partial [Tachysurus ichikawai]
MPSLVLTSSDNVNTMNDVNEGLDSNMEIKKKKDKAKKKISIIEESAECDPPAPKKLKREKKDTADGTVQSSPDVNGNVRKKAVKVHSGDELVNPAGEQPEKKKKKKKAATPDNDTTDQTPSVNGTGTKSPKTPAKVNGHLTDITPTPSSEDSSSESEKDVETPEQKEGAFSNFKISQDTIKLLQ